MPDARCYSPALKSGAAGSAVEGKEVRGGGTVVTLGGKREGETPEALHTFLRRTSWEPQWRVTQERA